MSVWSAYENRIVAHGETKRDASFIRESRMLNMKLPDSLSYHTVKIYPQEYGYNIESEDVMQHCLMQNVAIINSDNMNEKTICSLPSEDIELGSLVCWMGNHWLVCERDANTTIYTKAKLIQCNHLLRWISKDNQIMEQWCIIEDGTKYLTGEYEDKNFVVTRGDSRISMQIARNKYTVAFNREDRFLIDDPDSPHKMAYLLTKPLKRGITYNECGTFKFVLQEVTATEFDNHKLGIADYYKHFPSGDEEAHTSETTPDSGSDSLPPDTKGVWI